MNNDTEIQKQLSRDINDFANFVDENARSPEDKLIMASAMLTVVKSIYLECSLNDKVAQHAFEKQLEDVTLIHYTKPTIH